MSGRKRHILVDTMGLLLKVKVHSAGIQDRDGAKLLVALARLKLERLVIVWADQAYRGDLAVWLWKRVGCLLEIVERQKDEAGHTSWGFVPLPKRWVVERTFAWFNLYRRLSKDYEYWPRSSESMIYLASSHLLLRRLCHFSSSMDF
jgi:putative transposase